MASNLQNNIRSINMDVRNIVSCTRAIIKHKSGWKYTRLPEEYQELTYIASTSARTQYINTGIYPQSNVRFEGKIMIYGYSSWDVIIGETNGDMDGGSIALRVFSNPAIDCSYAGHQNIQVSVSYNTELTFNAWNCGITVNGSSNSKSALNFTPNSLPLWMFGGNNNGSLWRGFYGRIYYMKIYNNNNLVREFIPARRKSDNVLGMYDMQNDVFYTNNGTGSFTAGGEVK